MGLQVLREVTIWLQLPFTASEMTELQTGGGGVDMKCHGHGPTGRLPLAG